MSPLPPWAVAPPRLDARHRLGHAGELAAGALLERHGYAVLAHRLRLGRHELDLVARRDGTTCFVEVKTRAGRTRGAPDESLSPRQRRTLVHLGGLWVQRYGRPGEAYRFDLMAVRPVPEGWAIRWVRDAFR